LVQNTQFTGLGPSIWMAKFTNTATLLTLDPYYTRPWAALTRQDFALPQIDPINYTVTYSSNATVATGTIDYGYPLKSLAVPSAGLYTYAVSFPYQSHGISLT